MVFNEASSFNDSFRDAIEYGCRLLEVDVNQRCSNGVGSEDRID